jgi:hypothetical protein
LHQFSGTGLLGIVGSMRGRAEKSGNMLENTLRHLHLLPGSDSSYHCQRPENKAGDSAYSSLINPSSGTGSPNCEYLAKIQTFSKAA